MPSLGQYITGYAVANLRRYPMRRNVAFVKALEKKPFACQWLGNADMHEGLNGGGGAGVWYSLFIKNLAHYSSH